jgi:hypothetical protein
MVSRSIYKLKLDTIYMYDIPFDRSFLQLSNGIRHIMPSTDTKLELTAKASMAQPVLQPAVCANGLNNCPTVSQVPGNISLWISFAAIFFAHKNRTTPCCSIVVHVFRGAAIL